MSPVSSRTMRISSRLARASLLLTLVLLGTAASALTSAAQLHVAVAANFLGTLQKLATAYQGASADTLVASGGASGQLYTQIHQGAPFDLFFSADADRPAQLEHDGLTVPGSRFTYAIGTLVLWSPKPGVIDRDAHMLRGEQLQHISIADPRAAPYGAAAQQVMMALGIWDRLNAQQKIVVGQNITQAWQFAASGNATVAFVALSQVLGADGRIAGSSWIPPQKLYAPIAQDAVILKRTGELAAAQSFVSWLRTSRAAAQILHAAGYRSP